MDRQEIKSIGLSDSIPKRYPCEPEDDKLDSWQLTDEEISEYFMGGFNLKDLNKSKT